MSDDGRYAIVLIAFIGSVFSPYYASARRRGPTDPCNHAALNVALYGDGVRRWTMTERGTASLQRDATTLQVGPSALRWEDAVLVIDLDEIAMPIPRRVRGRIRLEPLQGALAPQALDAPARHRWQPLAPRARVTVDFDAPALHWSGDGYLDANWGDEPLEKTFTSWQWSRTALPDNGSLLRYDTRARDGTVQSLNLRLHADGSHERRAAPPTAALPGSRWGIAREAETGSRLIQTLEDGPFYARSLLETPWGDQSLPTMHESLSLARFSSRWVQAMLPFRMPRPGF
ncbi:MAG TPA: carotenoid 1,2-hydratase [Burkholderiaceae bacterium]|nr:carotenoid 1,2-hydratase [Burkholderiaceae bacterium]